MTVRAASVLTGSIDAVVLPACTYSHYCYHCYNQSFTALYTTYTALCVHAVS
jgi:hypothetical protein